MYIGVLPQGSRPCRWLKAVRAGLSIVAWILSLGHMAVYGATYLPRLLTGGRTDANVVASFVVALVLLALLPRVLGVTSFNAVKRRMRTETWKNVQRLAYPFFLLVYAHLLLMLAPSACTAALPPASVAVCSAVFAAYIVLRLVRTVRKRRARDAA